MEQVDVHAAAREGQARALDEDQTTAWFAAARENDAESLLAHITAAGASIVDLQDPQMYTALHHVVGRKEEGAYLHESVEILLRSGANCRALDKDGLSPVSWAAKAGRREVLAVLLDCAGGEAAAAPCNGGYSPLHYAA